MRRAHHTCGAGVTTSPPRRDATAQSAPGDARDHEPVARGGREKHGAKRSGAALAAKLSRACTAGALLERRAHALLDEGRPRGARARDGAERVGHARGRGLRAAAVTQKASRGFELALQARGCVARVNVVEGAAPPVGGDAQRHALFLNRVQLGEAVNELGPREGLGVGGAREVVPLAVVRRTLSVCELTLITRAMSCPGTVTRCVGPSPVSTDWIASVLESMTATVSRVGLATYT